jgi:hypothetical protein
MQAYGEVDRCHVGGTLRSARSRGHVKIGQMEVIWIKGIFTKMWVG